MLYDLVLDGEVLRTIDFGAQQPDDLSAHTHKGLWLPHIEVGLDTPYNINVQVSTGPVITFSETQVTYTWSVRDKISEECTTLLVARQAAISREFHDRDGAPIRMTLGGQDKEWDADIGAVGNLTLIALGVATGNLDPNAERTWTAYGEMSGTSVAMHELLSLLVAIGQRRDVLFGKKKQKEYALSLLTDPNDIYAFDASIDWA